MNPEWRLHSIQRITSRPEKHRAFTDLIRWRGRYYLSFREATSHLSYDGRLVLLSSANLVDWNREELAGDADLRDAKFLAVGDALHLYGFERTPETTCVKYAVLGSTGSIDAHGAIAGTTGLAFWRPKLIHGRYYCSGYRVTSEPSPDGHVDSEALLFTSDNAIDWEQSAAILRGEEATETELLELSERRMAAFIRRDGPRFPTLSVGISAPPYSEWMTGDSGRIIHAVAACWWRGQVVVVGRYMREPFPDRVNSPNLSAVLCEQLNRNIRTNIWTWDEVHGFQLRLELPSQGDCSYAGIWPDEDRLAISYYSQHELLEHNSQYNTLDGGAEVFIAEIR
jgi:hypothetical protein